MKLSININLKFLPMKNSNCIICGNEFKKPREGKLFCSEKCKQIHRRRKDDPESLTHEIIEEFKEAGKLEHLDIEFLEKIYLLKKKPIWRIDINEHKAFCVKYKNFNLIDYALIRKNLTGSVTLEQINEYFELISGGFNYSSDSNYNEEKYNGFVALITAGLVEFYYGEERKSGNK